MSIKYYHATDGEWIHIAKRYRDQCCHCGLVHDMEIRLTGKKLEIRATVNSRATAAIRRGKYRNR